MCFASAKQVLRPEGMELKKEIAKSKLKLKEI
jgi:hypothetical protein